MHIDPLNAINMLQKMGCSCEMLNQVADVPGPVVEALHSAWKSMQQDDLQNWEIELIVARMQVAANAKIARQH